MSLTAGRMVGAFPLSIATSIALEYACGVASEANPDPKPAVLTNYNQFWINLRTLFRNLIGALEKGNAALVLPNELVEALQHEMEVLVSTVRSYSHDRTRVVFYVSNYRDVASISTFASVRDDRTQQQKAYTALQRATLEQLLKEGHPPGSQVKVFEHKLKPEPGIKALILTHYAYDLVSYSGFGSLSLIESHTGAIKDRDKWHTKYYNGKDLPPLPLMEGLLGILGDSETYRPLGRDLRQAIIELANKYHWTPVTTRDKVLYGINQLTNPYLKEILKTFF